MVTKKWYHCCWLTRELIQISLIVSSAPLFLFSSQEGHLSVVQVILASGREVDTKTKSIAGTAPWNNKTAAEHARFQGTRARDEGEPEEDYTRKKRNGPLIANLLDSF